MAKDKVKKKTPKIWGTL